ncbi:MAG: hypothetical protein AB8B79_09900 [Granulosicoccus sp.]
MRLTTDIRALFLYLVMGGLVLPSNVNASSVQVVVDAALDQNSLQTAENVTLNIVRAAANQSSVGVVVYDEVFQRSSEIKLADESDLQTIGELFSSIAPSESSNIAVGIEKGISELSAEGGVLLVFGNNDILLADTEAANKYRDWLQLILLPDAASKSISIVLASSQATQLSSLDSIFLQHPDNRVVSYSDTANAIAQLSELLPFPISSAIEVAGLTQTENLAEALNNQPAGVETNPATELITLPTTASIDLEQIPQDSTASVVQQSELPPIPVSSESSSAQIPQNLSTTTTDQAIVSEQTISSDGTDQIGQTDNASLMRFIPLAIVALLFFVVLGIVLILLKRKRDSKNKASDSSMEQTLHSGKSRYLPPNHRMATALTTAAIDSDVQPADLITQANASHDPNQTDRFDEWFNDEDESSPFDKSLEAATPEQTFDNQKVDQDFTAPREELASEAITKIVELDQTLPNPAVPVDDGPTEQNLKINVSDAFDELDELDELRNLTKTKQQSLI